VKLGGLAFIVYLAVRLMREGGAVDLSRREAPPRSRLFASGLGLQLANPNALVYFGGMLPAYIDPTRPAVLQALIIMASVTVTELLGLMLYARSADALAKLFVSRSFAVGFFRIAALSMVASAVLGVYTTWRCAPFLDSRARVLESSRRRCARRVPTRCARRAASAPDGPRKQENDLK
jgi:homoserine/homoserine lactone efflux protein